MACCICENRRSEKRRQTFSMVVDASPEPLITFVHRGEPAMRRMSARLEPTVDALTVLFGDVHDGCIRRAFPGVQEGLRSLVGCCLFGLEDLPVIRRVAPGTHCTFDETVRLAPLTPHFLIVLCRV